MSDRSLAAYHEAGHAAVAAFFDLRVADVSIDTEGHGICRHEPCEPNVELVIVLAGIEAEARVLGVDAWWSASDGELAARCGDDVLRVAKLSESVDAPRALEDLRRIFAIDSVWAHVDAIAAELLERGRAVVVS